MKELKEFTLSIAGLKLGEHLYDFKINKAFFEQLEYDEFNDAAINLEAVVQKTSRLLEFTLNFEGTVNVFCDVSNEPYDQFVSRSYQFTVRFGEEYNDLEEDLLILPYGSTEVNIQQYVYESVILSVPLRRVHHGVLDGSLKSEILDKLEELRPKSPMEGDEDEQEQTDPRWDSLKKLLTDKQK